MGSHPVNLALRFALEMGALLALGVWGSRQAEGVLSVVLALGVPIFAAALWGMFAVPDDPSRSGKAPVPVAGIIRLVLEIAFFSFATWVLFNIGSEALGLAFGIAVIFHTGGCRPWLDLGWHVSSSVVKSQAMASLQR